MINKTGKASHLLIATLLTLMIVGLAIYLNSFESSPVAPATAIINADYQAESAIIMQIQRSKRTKHESLKSFEKEIMPGVVLQVSGNESSDGNWDFSVTLKGQGLDTTYSTRVAQSWPDRIVYQ